MYFILFWVGFSRIFWVDTEELIRKNEDENYHEFNHNCKAILPDMQQ